MADVTNQADFLNLPPYLRPIGGGGVGQNVFPGFGSPIQGVTAAPPAEPAPAPGPAPAPMRAVPEQRGAEERGMSTQPGPGTQFANMTPDQLAAEVRNRAMVGDVGLGGMAAGATGLPLAPAASLFGLGSMALERFTREDFAAALQNLFASDPAAAQQIIAGLSPQELAYLETVMAGGTPLPTAAPERATRPDTAPGFETPPIPPPLPPERQGGGVAGAPPGAAVPPVNPPVPPPTPPRLPAGASGGAGDAPESFGQTRTGEPPTPPSLPPERQPEDFGQTRTGAPPVPERRPSQEPSESQSSRGGGGAGASPARGDVSNAGR